jgi:peroxiredoxin Q/BCP
MSQKNALKVGERAPDFCLPATREAQVCLKDLHGSWVALFFYAKDNTKG